VIQPDQPTHRFLKKSGSNKAANMTNQNAAKRGAGVVGEPFFYFFIFLNPHCPFSSTVKLGSAT
jgi:hypothetical protein